MSLKRLILLSLLFIFSTRAAIAQDINEDLWAAARKGDAAAVEALLAKGANVNAKFRYGATALSYASDKGHTEVVRVLLAHGADVEVEDTFYKSRPIHWAAINGHAAILKMLLDKGAKGIEDVLMIGVENGNAEVVRVALDKGGISAETLSAALGGATKSNRTEIAAMLTKAGAVPPPKADFQVDAETLNSYVGTYKSERGMELVIALNKEGKLTGTAQGQTLTLAAFDKVKFRPVEVEGLTLTFNSENGKVTGFILKQGGTDTIFKRVEQPAKQP